MRRRESLLIVRIMPKAKTHTCTYLTYEYTRGYFFTHRWRTWRDIETAKSGWDAYIADVWNQFDLLAYSLLFVGELLNVLAFVFHSNTASWWMTRVLLLGIIIAYLKIFKLARSSKR